MKPRTNFQLARIFGIRVGVGFSWFVVLFVFIIFITPIFHNQLGGSRTTAYLVAVASVLSFFASLVLHELGHALVARRSGLQVAGIDLWALGGTTRTEEAKDPATEFRVAAAGPFVTLLVIVACIVAGRLLTDSKTFFELAVAEEGTRATPVLVWLSWLATINVLVLVFNLVPAFPLDGGRIAHAAIWWRTGDRNRATHATGRAGQGFALLLGAVGLWGLGTGSGSAGLACILLAYFLYQAASAAVVQGALARRIQSITVADIMDRQPVTIPASATLLDAHEDFFLRYRWPWFAVEPGRPLEPLFGLREGGRCHCERGGRSGDYPRKAGQLGGLVNAEGAGVDARNLDQRISEPEHDERDVLDVAARHDLCEGRLVPLLVLDHGLKRRLVLGGDGALQRLVFRYRRLLPPLQELDRKGCAEKSAQEEHQRDRPPLRAYLLRAIRTVSLPQLVVIVLHRAQFLEHLPVALALLRTREPLVGRVVGHLVRCFSDRYL